jgi:hypothetical protein
MESKINTEVAIISRIAELSYDHDLTDFDIQGIIWTEFKENRSTAYIAKVIADFVAEMYGQQEVDDWNEAADAGYDPYLNTYTDDC